MSWGGGGVEVGQMVILCGIFLLVVGCSILILLVKCLEKVITTLF